MDAVSGFLQFALNVLKDVGPAIVLALLVVWLGHKIAKRLSGGTRSLLMRAPDADATIAQFFAALIFYLLMVVVVMAALSILGINTSSVTGIVLGFGTAMAFVLKDALANFAAGIMIMIFRPYQVGDEVEIGGTKGIVRSVELTATRMQTRDNVELIVATGNAWGGTLRNHSALGVRRLDMDFGVEYGADIDKAIETIIGVAAADKRVHVDPAPWAKVVSLGESSVDIQLRVWCDYEDYRKIKMDISQPVKAALDAAGIGIPYPHIIKIRQKVKNSKARNRIAKLNKIRNSKA